MAAVFAIHPLRVESVAWVAERKDVLSGLFFMLTLWAYTRYAQGRSRVEWRVECRQRQSGPRHSTLDARLWLVLLFFALGLMCKPMLVTLPLVLLLLDYWPLNRFAPPTPFQAIPGNGDSSKNHSIPWRLIVEKVPLLALTGAACVATMVAQKDIIVRRAPRFANRQCSGVLYHLPAPDVLPGGAGGFIPVSAKRSSRVGNHAGGRVAGWHFRRGISPAARTALFIDGLAVVSGNAGSGDRTGPVRIRAHADRYTYLPQIGLYLMLTWGAAELCAGWRYRRVVLGGGATVILVALIFCARAQTAYWRNNELLWTHTLACTSGNAVAHNNLGNVLFQKGKVDEAITHFQKALQINPDYAEACYNLGNALLQKGRVDEAIAQYQKALQITPNNTKAHNNLGNALLQKGSVDEAIAHYQQPCKSGPTTRKPTTTSECPVPKGQCGRSDHPLPNRPCKSNPTTRKPTTTSATRCSKRASVDEAIAHYQTGAANQARLREAHNNLGNALLQKGNVDEAITHFQQALQIKPDYAEAHNNLGNALLKKGRVDEAITHYQRALQIKPDSLSILNNLAWLLATCPDAHLRDGVQAVQYAGRACELTHYGVAPLVGTLAAAYAEAGRYDDAIAAAQKACALAAAAGERELLEKNQKLLTLYRAHQPYHEAAEQGVPTAP